MQIFKLLELSVHLFRHITLQCTKSGQIIKSTRHYMSKSSRWSTQKVAYTR
jgi:hypothetical protein